MNQVEEIKKDIFAEFIEARKKFLKELMFWLGVMLLVGFIRVNFFGATVSGQMPEYIVYTFPGIVTERMQDIDGYIESQVGKGKPNKEKN